MAKTARKKADTKRTPKPADAEIAAKRAKAYADLEPYMGTIASNLFDCTDRDLYDFAVHHLEEKLDDLKARYDALDFRP